MAVKRQQRVRFAALFGFGGCLIGRSDLTIINFKANVGTANKGKCVLSKFSKIVSTG